MILPFFASKSFELIYSQMDYNYCCQVKCWLLIIYQRLNIKYLSIHFVSKGDSASTAAAQKLLEGSESEELPPLDIPETVPLPTEGVKYESLSANQIKQVMDKMTGLVYRRIREYVIFLWIGWQICIETLCIFWMIEFL